LQLTIADTYAANRIGYVNATAADGNCFYHALIDQIHRENIFQLLINIII